MTKIKFLPSTFITFDDLPPTEVSPERLIEFKLQKNCSVDELLEFSLEQVMDIASCPDVYREGPKREAYYVWLYGPDFRSRVEGWGDDWS